MKYKLLRFSLLSIFVMLGGFWGNSAWAADRWGKTDAANLESGDVVANVDHFRDIKADLTQLQALATGSNVYITVAEDGTISQTDNAENAAATLKGNWHGTAYGWSNFTASVPVEGCVKITYATHDFGNDIVVTNAAGEQVAKLNTIGAKWSSNHDNVVVTYYRTNEATTLHFSNANYNPYFAVEAIDPADLPEEVTVYNVTFAAGEGTGVAPAAVEVEAGNKITAPKNYTLYKEGATLTGWNDGAKTYAVGAEITPEADMTLTAVFTNNEVSLADRTAAVTLNYVLNGYNDNPKHKFEGNKGIMVTQANIDGKTIDVKVDVDATGGKFAHNGSGWHQVNKGTKVTVPSCKGAAIAVATYNDASSVTFGGEAGAADGNTATYEAADDAETIVIEEVSNNYWNNLSIILPAITDEPVGEWVWRDFGIDLVNILTEAQRVDQTPQQFGVVVAEDGTQTQVAYGAENANISLKGKYWNDHGWVNTEAVVKVEGPVQIDLGNCYYGSGDIVVKDATGAVVASGTMEQKHTCWDQDKTSIVSVKYKGEATTLTISYGSYLPYIGVKSITIDPDEPVSQDITGTWSYADKGVMDATMALSGSSEAGEVEAMEKNGLKMIVEANGATFRNNSGTNIQVRSGAVFKIPVKNAGDLVTVKGYPDYSYYSIGNSDEIITNTQSNPVTTYTAKRSDAEVGYVAVTSVNDNNYYYSLSVVQYAPKEKITLDNEPATVTFPFDEGTEDQKATFSNADYFLNSKVTHGSNWSILDKQTYMGTTETRLAPVEQHNDNLTDDDAVSFLFTPKPGFAFTPTKVSFKANRFGTDNGLIDVYWQNSDGTTVELDKGVKPERNNSSLVTEKNYDVTGATPGEGTCGLKLFLYHLQDGKQMGLADIVIEGTLSGTEKEVPILASFKVNGTEYAAEDVFGELYEATLELKNSETMVSAENPLTDVTAASGEVGELTYEGTQSQCKVTIPLTAADTQMDYVLNVIYKPFCTLEYVGVDGTTVLKTQTVEKDAAIGEFACDIAEVAATKEGYKARGWFKTSVLGEKFTTADVITGNTKLYAIQTEIEEASTHKKYTFDLTNKFFYAEDHEAFNPAGDGFYWHDAQHGWAFKNGNTVDLLVGPKATVTVTLCQYGSATGIAVKKDGETLATIEGKSDGDGGTAVFNYEGEPGTLTLEMQCGGEMYIHGMKIVNTAEVNFESEGNWYFVKAGDAGSLIDVLDVVNGVNAAKDAERSFIFLPDGTYDLDTTVKTAITGHNISLIGQSMDNTIIVTKPDKSIEGLGKADLLDISGTNLYLQDLTLQNALDYYNAGSAGRAAVIQDAGNRTIGKNVRMLSYQDTYYSSNSSQQAYWEDCDIHGTVDFICGGGDIRFQNTTISLEPRKTDGTGGRTIVAPTTTTQFGYVFDGCTVVDLAKGKGDWNFGRTWQNEPITVYLNTTLDNNAAQTLVSSRWTQKGMNNKDPKLFGEYGTKDAAGNDITPSSNIINSFGGSFETILTADQAAGFAYDKMFTDWDPKTLATQVQAPNDAKLENGTVTWSPTYNNASAYALFKNGVFVGLTQGFSFDIQVGDDDVLTLRAANPCGGLGEPVTVTVVTGIDELATDSQPADNAVYNMQGVRVQKAQKGLYIINGRKVVIK
ncbi:MAG: InlB B-repeat-containing protein [Prevotella sp.]|nr:InlB B-repeat-containing protein [Prevotella sp.]